MNNFTNFRYKFSINLLFFILIINLVSCIDINNQITDDEFIEEINAKKDSIIRENDIKNITIVMGQDYPPYHFVGSDEEIFGISIEIVREVASMMGIEVKFKQYPWLRCMHLVNIGLVDGMLNILKTEQRESFMSFYNNLIINETNYFWTTINNDINYSGNIADELADYTISVIQGYSYGESFEAVRDILNIDDTSTGEESLVRQLINDRTDIILSNDLIVNWHSTKLNAVNKIKMLEPYVSQDGLYIGFSRARGLDNFAKVFSDKLNKFKQTEEYQKIINKYN